MTSFFLVVASFPIGILIGLTGIGGAALMTPFLILVLSTRADVAIGTDLVYSVFTKAAASWMYWRQGHVDLLLVGKLASASLPASILGSIVMTRIDRGPHGDERLRALIGIVLMIVALLTIVRSPKVPLIGGVSLQIATLSYACGVGFLVGLTSIGSGSLILPLLIIVNRLAVVRAVGTDILHATVLVVFSSILHASSGGVDWHLIPFLLVGSLPGVMIGSRLAPNVPENSLRRCVTAVLMVSALKLLL